MRKIFLFLGLLLAGVSRLTADSGESVVLIYNSIQPASKGVAEHYAAVRHVPADHLLGLELPTTETMTREEFRSLLQKPLLKWLEDRKLFIFKRETDPNRTPTKYWKLAESKIRYAVLCYGVPTRILEDSGLEEKGAEKIPAQMRKNGAAVDSELTLLPVEDLKLLLSGPIRNPAYAATNAADMQPVNGILMVARLDGPSAEIARGLVDKAVQAETEGLWGRAYFDWRGLATNDGYKIGDDMMRNAADFSRQFGFETIVDEKPETFSAAFPMSQIALYAGWYDENVSGPFTRPNVELMPGAFAFHLHSVNAAELRQSKKHWVGPLLAKGVTATMGCVDEPFLEGNPDMGAFFFRLLNGFTFGEAAWSSQLVLSWQTTVVGDPLYRPFGKNPREQHEYLEKKKSKLLEWSHLRVANLNIVKGFPAAEVITYLETNGQDSPVLLEKLGDLLAKEGKPESAIETYEKALKAGPSPQQEIRLILTLAEKDTAAGKEASAFGLYEQLLKKFPDYPDRPAILKKLIPLAAKLKKPTDQFEKELGRSTK